MALVAAGPSLTLRPIFLCMQVNISMLLRNIISIIGSLTVMFILNASLTGVLLAVVPIISISAVQYG